MADPSRDSDEHIGDDPGTPRWVKLFGIVALALILSIAVVFLINGGGHGPGMHTP